MTSSVHLLLVLVLTVSATSQDNTRTTYTTKQNPWQAPTEQWNTENQTRGSRLFSPVNRNTSQIKFLNNSELKNFSKHKDLLSVNRPYLKSSKENGTRKVLYSNYRNNFPMLNTNLFNSTNEESLQIVNQTNFLPTQQVQKKLIVFNENKVNNFSSYARSFTNARNSLKNLWQKIMSFKSNMTNEAIKNYEINRRTLDLSSTNVINNQTDKLVPLESKFEDNVKLLVERWAPLIYLAPGETFMPDSVDNFLKNVFPVDLKNKRLKKGVLPIGSESKTWFLEPEQPLDQLLNNTSSFLYGKDPGKNPVPVYAVINRCSSPWNKTKKSGSQNSYNRFHVTYWFFFPFNEGKNFCTLNLSIFGQVPIPQIFNKCIGKHSYYGNHVGDWEHISLEFTGEKYPTKMYVSAHEVGAYYRYNVTSQQFSFLKQDARSTFSGKPVFPKAVRIKDGHPLLFCAKGSHGFWGSPGKHWYFRVPRLLDWGGFGSRWETWRNLSLIEWAGGGWRPRWMGYLGRWGSKNSLCHPITRLGINFCQISHGPTGIPNKRHNFLCPNY